MSSWSAIAAGITSSGGPLLADEMILLTDGSILIHNADTGAGTIASPTASEWMRMSPDSTGNYSNPSWSSTGPMTTARQYFGSGMLQDGRVFVVGGEYSTDLVNTGGTGTDSPLGEIFDPVTNQWAPMVKPATYNYIQGDVPSCVLADGRVLFGAINTNQTVLWDPAYNYWTAAGSGGLKATQCAEETWTLLPDESVLTVDVFGTPNAGERYVPATDAWVPAGTAVPASSTVGLVLTSINDPNPPPAVVNVNEIGPAILLPNGKLFAIGATGITMLFDYLTNSWSNGPSFPTGNTGPGPNNNLTAIDAPACLLPNGKIVCVAGNTVFVPGNPPGYFSNSFTFFEFDPSVSASPIPPLDLQPGGGSWPGPATFTYQCWFLMLPSGQLLCSAGQSTLYLYRPDGGPEAAWQPTITSFPGTMSVGHTYTITGTLLNGLSQAVSYGDDGQMATNYPLVQVTSDTTTPPTVAYLPTFNFSSMGVAVAGPVSTEVEVPCDLPPGQWQLVVIANGIASDPVTVEIVGRSTANPFNLGLSPNFPPAAWGHNDTTSGHSTGADDVGDSVQIGKENSINTSWGNRASDASNSTAIENYAEQNAAFIGHNFHPGDGVVGVFGRSDGCRGSIGVGGAATGWGVAGVSTTDPVDVLNDNNSADFSPYPSNVGVFGAGDSFGVYGQSRISEGQAATSLPAAGPVGVYGVGDVSGVQGDSDFTDPARIDVGTGVTGTSVQGAGVVGRGLGSADPTAPIQPYVGVCGVSQTSPSTPYPVQPELIGTGVLGMGDVRGGVFGMTPAPAAQTFANVRLEPVRLPERSDQKPVSYTPSTEVPVLPRNGAPGDIVAVQTTQPDGEPSVELWVCITPLKALSDAIEPAVWARIHFDTVVRGG
jgi:hypothetical protein